MKKYLLSGLSALAFFASFTLAAQTPSDAIMMKKNEACFALIYDHGAWDHYWEGADLRVNGNVGTLTRVTVMPMLAYGITNNLNLLVGTPYVKTHASGGQMAGVHGFQDLSLSLKYRFVNKDFDNGKLEAFVTTAFSTPMTNYLSDYLPFSLGLGTNEFTLRGIIQYKLKNGFYVRAAAAYLWRGQTEVERDYYYNNGSYYTTFMDVPNALNYHGAIGVRLLENNLKLEATYVGLNSTSGDDIRRYNSAQPTNKVEFNQVGFSAQYYFKKPLKGLGLLAYYSQMISGRNMGQFSNIGAGATYQVQLKNKKS